MNRKKKLVQTVGCIVFFVCSIFRLAATLQEQSDRPVYGVSDLPVTELNENDRIINTFVYADGTTPFGYDTEWNGSGLPTLLTDADIAYSLHEQSDRTQFLAISVHSTSVASGTGKTASVNYLFDA